MNTTLSDYELVNPDAGAMIEALRAFGYHLETSIADIIDNSISAGAHNVWINPEWNGDFSTISITDDGTGMSEKVLVNAMRAGSSNPLLERDPEDLGRFGLGLKTASFSQCRKLTVGSKLKGGDVSVRCWDLDYVNKCGEWRLLNPGKKCADELSLSLNKSKSGTIVLWEKIDRITKGMDCKNKKHENQFYDHLDVVKKHLSMVFHRYLEKSDTLKIFLKNIQIKPWDPFLKTNLATQQLSTEPIDFYKQKITVQPYILPHRSKLDDKTYENAGDPGGWTERQGFYVYRNKRLIVPGDWLGLGFRKEQHTKLARILVDIPNSLDGEWKIDVKKSTARPPALIREDFKRIARLTLERATAVYQLRGGKVIGPNPDDPFNSPWLTKVHHGFCHYSINRDHPIVSDIYQNSSGEKKKIEAMLRLIEETVPVPLIILNESKNPDKIKQPFEGSPSEELQKVMHEVFESMINIGVLPDDAKIKLLHMKPFSDYPNFVREFLKNKYEVKNE
jgi:hypothetical protein